MTQPLCTKVQLQLLKYHLEMAEEIYGSNANIVFGFRGSVYHHNRNGGHTITLPLSEFDVVFVLDGGPRDSALQTCTITYRGLRQLWIR